MKNILLRRLLDSSKKGAWLTNDLPWNEKRVLAYIIYQFGQKNKFLQKLTQGDIFGKKDEQSSKSCFSDFSFA